MINVENNSAVEEDNKKGNLLTNLTVDNNVAAEEDYKRKSRRYPNISRKLRRLTNKPILNISRTPEAITSFSSAKNVFTRPVIQHVYSYGQILWIDNNYYKDNNYLTMKSIDNNMEDQNIYV